MDGDEDTVVGGWESCGGCGDEGTSDGRLSEIGKNVVGRVVVLLLEKRGDSCLKSPRLACTKGSL